MEVVIKNGFFVYYYYFLFRIGNLDIIVSVFIIIRLELLVFLVIGNIIFNILYIFCFMLFYCSFIFYGL